MKLYRGIKTNEFHLIDSQKIKSFNASWTKILNFRATGNLNYQQDLNDEIIKLFRLQRLQTQHFSDNKKIANSYAKSNKGLLITIDLPTREILQKFSIEFQNFGKRKKQFKIVYAVNALTLRKNAKKWKLKTTKFK
jgi:hypothetical protein